MTRGNKRKEGPGAVTCDLDRRAFLAGAGAAAAGYAIPAPAFARPILPVDPDAIVIVDGWVCRRAELSKSDLPYRVVRIASGPSGQSAPVRPVVG